MKGTSLEKELASLIDPNNSVTYVPRWPLFVMLCSAITCFSCSAAYHLFYIRSWAIYQTLLKFDIGGICFLIMGSIYPVNYYVFACKDVLHLRYFFMALITISTLVTFCILMVDKFSQHKYKPLRNSLFVFLGFSAMAPFFYLMWGPDLGEKNISKYSVVPWGPFGCLYIVGAVINVKRFPECYFPKVFDHFGSSH